MENNTPIKQCSFSPVKLIESPTATLSGRNLTGLPRVARDIAADVYNNIQLWNDNYLKGAKIVKEVAGLKADDLKGYPAPLERLTLELYKIVEVMSSVCDSLKLFVTQMKALEKLHKQSGPLFLTLTPTQLANLIEDVAVAYLSELNMKRNVLENIAHCDNKNNVMFYAACWSHQIHVTRGVSLKVKMLLVETGHQATLEIL